MQYKATYVNTVRMVSIRPESDSVLCGSYKGALVKGPIQELWTAKGTSKMVTTRPAMVRCHHDPVSRKDKEGIVCPSLVRTEATQEGLEVNTEVRKDSCPLDSHGEGAVY